MPITPFPFGVSSFGIPVVPGAPMVNLGQTFFVCNATGANGSDNNAGNSPQQPLATLQKAITLAATLQGNSGPTAQGAHIYVLPGHAENIIAAGTIALSTANVVIIGLGTGRARPMFTWTTISSATITCAVANVTWINCVFIGTGIASLATMFALTAGADDFTFDRCEFDFANATNQVVLGITITGCNRFKFINCHAHGTANAGCANFIQIVGAAGKQLDFLFQNSTIIGNFTTTLGAINNITVAMVNLIVRECLFVNGTASATKCIVTLTASTGLVMRNAFGIGSGAVPISMDAGWWAGNWTAAAVATNSALI